MLFMKTERVSFMGCDSGGSLASCTLILHGSCYISERILKVLCRGRLRDVTSARAIWMLGQDTRPAGGECWFSVIGTLRPLHTGHQLIQNYTTSQGCIPDQHQGSIAATCCNLTGHQRTSSCSGSQWSVFDTYTLLA
jgi:hypothetical protein